VPLDTLCAPPVTLLLTLEKVDLLVASELLSRLVEKPSSKSVR